MSEEWKQVAVVTVSDSVFEGAREDASGPALVSLLLESGYALVAQTVVPDEQDLIAATLTDLIHFGTPLIITTGGTGVGPRDVTPEATRSIVERLVPGLSEEMRRNGASSNRFAILSRGICGISETSLLVNLPGSPQGAIESLQAIIDVLPHALTVLCTTEFQHTPIYEE